MAFYGRNFLFDGVASESYNITISSVSDEETSKVADIEISSVKLYRREKEFLYGTTPSPVLIFPIKFNTPEDLSSEDFGLISKWLFGQKVYKKLQILQEDMTNLYFNCFLVDPEIIRVGNFIRGIKCNVRCDSPFAWTFPKTVAYTYSSPPSGSAIVFDNFSHSSGYLYPEVSFTMKTGGGDLNLVNVSDVVGYGLRSFSFTGLASGETITVDNDLQIITSSLGLYRLSNFNKSFFRLIPNRNNLTVTGNISRISFTYSFAKKIGG